MWISRPKAVVAWLVALVVLAAGVVVFVAAPGAGQPDRPVGPDVVAAPPATPELYRVAVVGDSYTGGSQMGGNTPTSNWVSVMVSQFRRDGVEMEARKDAVGESGYISPGSKDVTFGQLVSRAVQPDTQALVLFGSRNDSGQPGIEQAVLAACAEARKIRPGILIVVVGPPWVNEDVPLLVSKNRDEVAAGARAIGATFIDPIAERWFMNPDTASFIGADGIHPNDAGHTFMGQQIAKRLAGLLAALPATKS